MAHGVCSRDGEPCHCATDDHSWAISEELDRSGESDTSRFLAAGAARAWWVRTEQGRLAEAMPAIRGELAESENAILESNSILKFLRPDLYLTVLDPATADFKKSAQRISRSSGRGHSARQAQDQKSAWRETSLKPVAGRPVFRICPPPYVTPQIIEFVRLKLTARTLRTRRKPERLCVLSVLRGYLVTMPAPIKPVVSLEVLNQIDIRVGTILASG